MLIGTALAFIAVALPSGLEAQPQTTAQQSARSENGDAAENKTESQEPGTVGKMRTWGEKQQKRYEKFSNRLERFGISPEIGTLGQGSGLAAGVTYRKDTIGPLPLDLEATTGFSYRGYQRYELRIGMLSGGATRTTLGPADTHLASQFDSPKDRTQSHAVYLDLRYRHSPLHRFYGDGPHTSHDDRTSFLVRGASYDLVGEYQPRKWLGLAARGGILDLNVGSGGDTKNPSTELVFSDLSAPGLDRQPLFLNLGTSIALDGRDSAVAPRSGGMAGVMVSRFENLDGPDSAFSRVGLDTRYFQSMSPKGVVAVRLLTSTDLAAGGVRVPFYLQQTLGGGDTLRGFERARFRDTSLLHVSAEYRHDVHRHVELAGFYDVGQVAPRLADVSFGDLDSSYGVGMRFKGSRSVKFRVDLAFSREGQRLILSSGPIF